jgi:HK97 family phage major capsid protein
MEKEQFELALTKGLDTVAEQLKKEVSAIDAKAAEQIAQLNEDAVKKGETLADLSEKVNQVIANQGKLKAENEANLDFKAQFADALEKNFDRVQGVRKGSDASFSLKSADFFKDATLAGNLTGSAVAGYSLTPSIRGRRMVHFRDIPGVEVIPSATGIWKFYRNAPPANTGSFGTQTEGSAKAIIDYNWQEVTVTVNTEAGFARVSNQMLRDLPFLQSFLPGELREDYLRHEDNRFVNALMAATSAYSASASVYAERLIEYMGAVMARDYSPTAIVTTAGNWTALMNTKPSDYSLPGGAALSITAEGNIAVAGVPVVVFNGMTSGRTFVGDFSKVKIIQANALEVRFFEQDSDNVQKNMVTVRAEADVALAVLRSDWGIYAIS